VIHLSNFELFETTINVHFFHHVCKDIKTFSKDMIQKNQ
jgi:hypothetical protein